MILGFASTEGGCAHYRAELPARMLRDAHGIETLWTEPIDVDRDTGRIGFPIDDERGIDPDVVVLAAGYVRGLGAHTINAARRAGQIVIGDCDDWPWLPGDNPHYSAQGGNEKMAALRACDGVTVSTAYLRDMLATRGLPRMHVYVCRNRIDFDRYTSARIANEQRARDGSAPFTVGYRGLLHGFHDDDVRVLRGFLPDDVRFVHVGAADDEPRSFSELTGARWVERRSAQPFTNYGDALAGIDLALIPYAARPFSQAKSNIAALEWNAAGVPWVSDDEHGATNEMGRVSARDWRDAIDCARSHAWRRDLFAAQCEAAVEYSVTDPAAHCEWTHAITAIVGARTQARPIRRR